MVNYINATTHLVLDKSHTHSKQGFANYVKHIYIQDYTSICDICNTA